MARKNFKVICCRIPLPTRMCKIAELKESSDDKELNHHMHLAGQEEIVLDIKGKGRETSFEGKKTRVEGRRQSSHYSIPRAH